MVLMTIAEPGSDIQEPRRRKIGIGIDLGTTNSLVAHFDGDTLTVFEDSEGRKTLPSVVYYGHEETLIGHEALAQPLTAHADTIASAKRLMGKSREDAADEAHLVLADDTLAFVTSQGHKTPVEVSADILSSLASRAGAAFDDDIDGAVITVPAYFDDAQRQATRQAAELAGLKVLRLLNEPTAAAVAYGLDSGEEGTIAVYDLGGGTFDISILKLHRGVFEVLATGGDSGLGGDDFDGALAAQLAEQLGLEAPTVLQRRQLLSTARHAKELLTNDDRVVVDLSSVDGAPSGASIELTRRQFNALTAALVNKTLDACRRCVEDAGVESIDQVVLVGGSTRMPIIAEVVTQLFGKAPLCTIDPDLVVAMGAARQADVLAGNRSDGDVLLLDVTPLSLGVETYGGLVERLVPRNTTIPVTRAQEFTTARDGQTGLDVHVVQGEREQVADCRSLARFQLTGIPPMVAGAARIQVMFQVDADGLLEVSAQEQTTGQRASVVVKPSYGLADDQVADMLRASYTHAADDMAARQLTEARVDAEQLVDGVLAAIAVDGDLLSAVERTQLEQQVAGLRELIAATDADALRDAIERTGQATEVFAARRMDRSIQQALAGVSLEDLDEEVES